DNALDRDWLCRLRTNAAPGGVANDGCNGVAAGSSKLPARPLALIVPHRERDAKRGIVSDAPSGIQRLTFVDGGAALIGNTTSVFVLIDPRRRVVVDTLGLDSASVPDRLGNPVQGSRREQSVYAASWRWDPVRRTMIGAVGSDSARTARVPASYRRAAP